ncbi:hypothetical protein PVT67_15560 [Gallaecimonas kandeliae]|uniref:hypothetical protein n=1 Tax=Gallaecimonas kandeliae TaxID=3029055 RepID=UPI002647AAB2|nr:hypothetical protein [Gallaecimonas kandeliae]WKE65060.1 hypothetical protein PVT67_15560 [Gallaecimonas kandeliae]
MDTKDVLTLVALALTLLAGGWALAKYIGRLFTQQLDTQFTALNQRLTRIEESEQRNSQQVSEVERQLMALKAELPEKYVRAEDYIRGQSRLEAKFDHLANTLYRQIKPRSPHDAD